ncbi:MAG: hypothetical protein U9R72_11290 [Chloroflexota bacterium]|nr:hypothetical protein [Chloroflexota bacterium]
MSFDWTDYLDFAYRLYDIPESPKLEGLSEATYRSAASRAYYATFHCALDFACKEGFQPSGGGEDHWRLRMHFKDFPHGGKAHRKIAKDLDNLRRYRKEVDYDDAFKEQQPRSKAFWAIRTATSILETLDSIVPAKDDADS